MALPSSAVIDIFAKADFPAGALSNFAAHRYIFRGVACASMEGLLQALKFNSPIKQLEICGYVGEEAKKAGLNADWRPSQTLWWQNEPMGRESAIYQAFLDEAYDALCAQSEAFKKALLATGDAVLIHSLGVKEVTETVLTEHEFCTRLMALRAKEFK
jgi:predicted NAD-dependent protein-ADP-ribosyltransferase YbiA (DUF1768 family)